MKNYDDIIGLPHFVDTNYPPMSMEKRAAQFLAYKSLVGYEDLIEEKTAEILAVDDHQIVYDGDFGDDFGDDLPQ
ncbi:hypothetical protein IJH06_01360 [Candidatus Saccharibacteria bacterium]|nr:hypothetical protein [Candidatus Saccharibacteria bacterium]